MSSVVVGTASERPLTVVLGSVPHKLVHRSTLPCSGPYPRR